MSDTVPESRVGSRFGPYRLKRLLGRGGMGEVYEAEHTVKEWTVALKLLSEKFSADPVFRQRMQREARTAGRLQEPHVVPIHEYGEIDGQLYLEMRLIDGTDLDTLLTRFGPMPPPRSVAILRQVAAALDAAHAAGVMHRDVKPQNILITRDDFAYLVDFGIASASTDDKLTQMGTAIGTWKYMAPERFTNDEVTYRADIYALACVLHECLTGTPPYRSDSMGVLISAHMHEPIPRPSQARFGVPKAFDDVIARGMAKNPEDRYASAGDLVLAAHQALSTPDQEHAVTLLRESQQSVLPPTALPSAPSFRTPTPTPTPPPTARPYPDAAGPLTWPTPSGPATGAPHSGPIPAPATGQPAAASLFGSGGAWPGQPTAPASQSVGPPPWGQPVPAPGSASQWGQHPGAPPAWGQQPAPKRKRTLWLLVGAAAVVLVLVAVAAIVFWPVSPKPDPQAVSLTELDTGVLIGSSAAPITIDVFDEPICPPCGEFIRSSSDDMQKAVDARKIAIRYHLLDFLDASSRSHNYSTRAVAASYCVAAGNDPKTYQAFYAGLFARDFQPEENGNTDPSDSELAHLAESVGAPPSASDCIRSKQLMGTAKSKAAKGYSRFQTLSAPGTPAVFNGTAKVDISKSGWVDSLS